MTKRSDVIEPGFYRTRLVSKGIPVGVRFWFDEVDNCWCVEVDGRRHHADGRMIDPWEVWPYVEPVPESEFAFMERRREWAKKFDPSHPAANPFDPIDLSRMKPRF